MILTLISIAQTITVTIICDIWILSYTNINTSNSNLIYVFYMSQKVIDFKDAVKSLSKSLILVLT